MRRMTGGRERERDRERAYSKYEREIEKKHCAWLLLSRALPDERTSLTLLYRTDNKQFVYCRRPSQRSALYSFSLSLCLLLSSHLLGTKILYYTPCAWRMQACKNKNVFLRTLSTLRSSVRLCLCVWWSAVQPFFFFTRVNCAFPVQCKRVLNKGRDFYFDTFDILSSVIFLFQTRKVFYYAAWYTYEIKSSSLGRKMIGYAIK